MPVSDVWLTPPTNRTPRLWSLSSSFVIAFVCLCSKVWLGIFNKVKVHNGRRLHEVLDGRSTGKPLITISNHYSILDDFLMPYMCSWKQLLNRDMVRILPGAKNTCFRTYHQSLFFQLGKVVPIVRGDGVYQQCMNFCVDELNKGKWVHLFPEGKVNTTKEFMRLKWGVGRLIADCKVPPIVLPFWHLGMDEVMPYRRPYIPQIGKKVTVLIGEPMDFKTIMEQLRKQDMSEEEIRKCITDILQDEFWRLKHITEALHYGRTVDEENGERLTSFTPNNASIHQHP